MLEPKNCALCGQLILGNFYELDDKDEVVCHDCYNTTLDELSNGKGSEEDE